MSQHEIVEEHDPRETRRIARPGWSGPAGDDIEESVGNAPRWKALGYASPEAYMTVRRRRARMLRRREPLFKCRAPGGHVPYSI